MSVGSNPTPDITVQIIGNQIITNSSPIPSWPNSLAISLPFTWSGLVACPAPPTGVAASLVAAVDSNGLPINSGSNFPPFSVPVSLNVTQPQITPNNQGTGGTITATVSLPSIPNTSPEAYALIVNFEATIGLDLLQEMSAPWLSLAYATVLENPSNGNNSLSFVTTMPDTYNLNASVTSVGTTVNIPSNISASIVPSTTATQPQTPEADGPMKRGVDVSVPIEISGAGTAPKGGSTFLGAPVIVKLVFQPTAAR